MKRIFKSGIILLFLFAITSCGVNDIPVLDEQVKASWSEVQNQYQRRADLVPSLVEVVKKAAGHESETLIAVAQARSRITEVGNKDLVNNSDNMRQFQQAQAELGSHLKSLMIMVERYPQLQANQNFAQLSSQLEGVENRIALARREYIVSIQVYNQELRTFPGRIWHQLLYSDLEIKGEYFELQDPADSKAPKVEL